MKTHFALALSALLAATAAQASTLVYTPVNPAFGGNPANGIVLLNEAQAENRTRDPNARDPLDPIGGGSGNTALDLFNLALQNAILSRLTAAAVSGIVGPTGELTPGTIETTSFSIVIADIGGGLLQITTTDKVTGDSTTFSITNVIP